MPFGGATLFRLAPRHATRKHPEEKRAFPVKRRFVVRSAERREEKRISNEVPEHPCVSPVSNQVFERRLIEKYVAENGTDPITGQPLSEEQLVDIKGGADKNVVVFEKREEQIVATLKGHTKKVTSVIYHPSQIAPSVYGLCRATCIQMIRAHEAGVTGLSLHATGDYLLSSSEDQYWAFSNTYTGRILTKVADKSAACALTCAQFHPDGLIFGTGTAHSQIKIWDLKERTNVANFPGHSGPVTAIAFSENGYYLATGAQDSSLKLWDLRKLKNFKTITLDSNYEVKSLRSHSGRTHLAVAGSDIRVYVCKQWSEVLNFTQHTGVVSGVAFGEHVHFLVSTGMDRSVKFYSL
ncbi:hypothetical protein AGIG_G12805 [Arapaima gigas]